MTDEKTCYNCGNKNCNVYCSIVKKDYKRHFETYEYHETETPVIENITGLDFQNEVTKAYQKGATDGYNKANEWHSYAERPKEKLNALCFDTAQNKFILGFYDLEADEWIRYGGYETITIDLWKEIVPPGLD